MLLTSRCSAPSHCRKVEDTLTFAGRSASLRSALSPCTRLRRSIFGLSIVAKRKYDSPPPIHQTPFSAYFRFLELRRHWLMHERAPSNDSRLHRSPEHRRHARPIFFIYRLGHAINNIERKVDHISLHAMKNAISRSASAQKAGPLYSILP